MENDPKEVQAEIGKKEGVSQAAILYRHVKELSLMTYKNELLIESSIIKQSSQMQTAFSFVIVALFMVAPIVLQYCDSLSMTFYLIAFSSICFFLLASLIAATMGQWRMKSESFPDVSELENFISKEWRNSLAEEQQLKQLVGLLGTVQRSKADNNKKRVNYIIGSMILFFISIGLIAFWFVVGICKII